ncbi:hypothetical protein KY362_01300 [Candidatus Woesearchaeota archaeon]|nr:hypothetical protein [Candidatus Woesearchaeota archaeon]
MPSISRLVEGEIEEKPFLQEALAKGIINYGALASELQPAIEQELRKPVKHAAIMMALRRISEKLESRAPPKLTETHADMIVRSNLFILTLKNDSHIIDIVKKLHNLIDIGEDMLTITQGLREVSIITSMAYYEKIIRIFNNHDAAIKSVKTDMSTLSLRIPESAIGVSGYYFTVFRLMAWHNICITEVVSTYSELTLLLDDQDVTKAYNILRG